MSSPLIVQLDMAEFCEAADLSDVYVIEIVEHGILEPQGAQPGNGASPITNWLWPNAPPSCGAISIWSGKASHWRLTCSKRFVNCAPRTLCSSSGWGDWSSNNRIAPRYGRA